MSEEKKWSKDVETKWHPPEGFFEEPAEKIASGLKQASDGLEQASDRLNFYINRTGSNLSEEAKKRLDRAKELLHELYKGDS